MQELTARKHWNPIRPTRVNCSWKNLVKTGQVSTEINNAMSIASLRSRKARETCRVDVERPVPAKLASMVQNAPPAVSNRK